MIVPRPSESLRPAGSLSQGQRRSGDPSTGPERWRWTAAPSRAPAGSSPRNSRC